MPQHQHNGPFPPELLVSIFCHLDGKSLTRCSQVNRRWHTVLEQFQDVIWPLACKRDFENVSHKKFWSLRFPAPTYNKSWQDMYRITHNWYQGFVEAKEATPSEDVTLEASCVVGAPQEQGMFTNLSLCNNGKVIRSNPNYHIHHNISLMIQSPLTKEKSYLLPDTSRAEPSVQQHSIVCHYTHPSSHWLVTGALNGSVAIWDLRSKSLVRMWNGHRGRVLCISMNGEAVVSGGSDNMIRVWDFIVSERTTRRGMINISSYLSGRSDWYQGVGEIAVSGHLVACAPDASGPILIFSLLTGSLVYELKENIFVQSEWITEDITCFTRLCLTPFFLLSKGKVNHRHNTVPLIPTVNYTHSYGYTTKLKQQHIPQHLADMTPYQLYQYYQSVNETTPVRPTTSACINVWDLANGKLIYKLIPPIHDNYTISDIKLSLDYSKVVASIEITQNHSYVEKLVYWDFNKQHDGQSCCDLQIVQLDQADSSSRKTGSSWVCFT